MENFDRQHCLNVHIYINPFHWWSPAENTNAYPFYRYIMRVVSRGREVTKIYCRPILSMVGCPKILPQLSFRNSVGVDRKTSSILPITEQISFDCSVILVKALSSFLSSSTKCSSVVSWQTSKGRPVNNFIRSK